MRLPSDHFKRNSGLGAARAAANKTVVHPEKLTLSKAEHAVAKK
jgi:hypothetical protein